MLHAINEKKNKTAQKRKTIRERYAREVLDQMPALQVVPLAPELLDEILRTGLIILGGGGTGKSTVAKNFGSQMINMENGFIQVKIMDKVYNWVRGFEPILYQNITPETEELYWGEDHILYNAHFKDPDELKAVADKMVGIDYDLHFLYKQAGVMNKWVVWIIEEAQNILGRYALSGRKGKQWLTYITEGRNLNMSFIFVGRRAADIATQAVENAQGYLFLKSTGDRDKRKIRGICGKDAEVEKIVPKLKIGEAIYWNGVEPKKLIIPDYKTIMRPRLWKGGMGI